LTRNHLKLADELDLTYTNGAWQKTVHLNGHEEKWTILLSWGGNKLDTNISNGKQNTRILAEFASHDKNLTDVNFNYNTETDKVIVKQPAVAKTHSIRDAIGLFKGNWRKDPYLTFNVKAKN
jgi:hypothetical protein